MYLFFTIGVDYVVTLLPLIRNANFTENVFMKVSSKNPGTSTSKETPNLNLMEYVINVDFLIKPKPLIMLICDEITTKLGLKSHVVFEAKNFQEKPF